METNDRTRSVSFAVESTYAVSSRALCDTDASSPVANPVIRITRNATSPMPKSVSAVRTARRERFRSA
jgi:hypothetical protein